jgi:hypothetical protein
MKYLLTIATVALLLSGCSTTSCVDSECGWHDHIMIGYTVILEHGMWRINID